MVNRYQTNRNTFVLVNDAESGNLPVGQNIWIPNGIQPILTTRSLSANIPISGARRMGSCGLGINNGYSCGWCTWWAAYRRAQIGHPVPPGLGDAYTWKRGLPGSHVPQAGTVISFPGNHVGFVEEVNPDGSVHVSDMNHIGWDIVSHRTIPADQAANYLYLY